MHCKNLFDGKSHKGASRVSRALRVHLHDARSHKVQWRPLNIHRHCLYSGRFRAS